MIETQAQKELCDAIKASGGAAHKLSNRFITGVSDLLVKIPQFPALLIEVKLDKVSGMGTADKSVLVEPTEMQLNFLRVYSDAGMDTAVLSCVEDTKHKTFGCMFIELSMFDRIRRVKTPVRPLLTDHTWCKMGKERGPTMHEALRNFLKEKVRG